MDFIEIYSYGAFAEICFNDLALLFLVQESKMILAKRHIIEMSLPSTKNCVSVWVSPDRKFDLTFDMVAIPLTTSNEELYEALKGLLLEA